MKSPHEHSILATVTDPAVAKVWGLAGVSAICSYIAPIVGVLAGIVGIVYTIYRFRRDVKERTCDVRNCPKRHLPDED